MANDDVLVNFLPSSNTTLLLETVLLKKEYTNIENHTLIKDINNFMYLAQLNFSEDTPNQFMHMWSTLILSNKMTGS